MIIRGDAREGMSMYPRCFPAPPCFSIATTIRQAFSKRRFQQARRRKRRHLHGQVR